MPLNGNMLMKIWTISVLLHGLYQKTHKLKFLLYLWPVKRLKKWICGNPFCLPIGLKFRIWCLEIEVIRNVSEKIENWTGTFHLKSTKNQRCSQSSAAHSPALILLLWEINFSALNQNWNAVHSESEQSALITSESGVISAETLWDVNPSTTMKINNF